MNTEINQLGKAPLFDGTNYVTRSSKMQFYLMAQGFEVWELLTTKCLEEQKNLMRKL